MDGRSGKENRAVAKSFERHEDIRGQSGVSALDFVSGYKVVPHSKVNQCTRLSGPYCIRDVEIKGPKGWIGFIFVIFLDLLSSYLGASGVYVGGRKSFGLESGGR